jgi:protein SCO1/2
VIRRSPAATFGALVCTVALAACGNGGSGPSSSASLSGMVRSPKLQVGTVEISDVRSVAAGTAFTMRARPGSLLVVSFGYTSCADICPATLAAIRGARLALGAAATRVDVAFVTVDPAHDSPAVLRKFVGRFFTDAHLLRPSSAAQLETATRAFLVTSKVQVDGSFDHSASIAVVDAHGAVLLEWPFGIESSAMAHDLRALLDGIAT